MDLINRQDAIEVADAVWVATGDKNVAKVWQQIEDLPSAQPEIIRCKDCEYYKPIRRTDRWWCTNDLGINVIETRPDDFCSNAERRNDE